MKHRIAWCMVLFIMLTNKAMSENKEPFVINVNVNTANTAALDQKNSTEHISAPNNTTSTNVTLHDHQHVYQPLYDWCNQQSTVCKKNTTGALHWVLSNKIKSTVFTITTLYAYCLYQIYYANNMINKHASWSHWHHAKSLEELFACPQQQLEDDLLFEIQTKYVHPHNPTDFIYPLVEASNALQAEIQIIQDQISRYEVITQCRALPLFLIKKDDLAVLQEKYKKILFIKHIFASWCAHYKIDKNSDKN